MAARSHLKNIFRNERRENSDHNVLTPGNSSLRRFHRCEPRVKFLKLSGTTTCRRLS